MKYVKLILFYFQFGLLSLLIFGIVHGLFFSYEVGWDALSGFLTAASLGLLFGLMIAYYISNRNKGNLPIKWNLYLFIMNVVLILGLIIRAQLMA